MTVQRSMSNYSGRLCRVIHDDRAVIALLNEGTLIAYARYIVLSIIRFTIKSVNREEKNHLRKVHELASYHRYAIITLNFFRSYSTSQLTVCSISVLSRIGFKSCQKDINMNNLRMLHYRCYSPLQYVSGENKKQRNKMK